MSPVTVREVVMMGRYIHLGWFRKPTGEDRQAVEEAMVCMGVADLADRQLGRTFRWSATARNAGKNTGS